MKRRTRLFLLAGCALVLVLEAPLSLASFAAGWAGPYARRGELRPAAPGHRSNSVALLEFAPR